MYCSRCHAGSEHASPGPCRQCGGKLDQADSPFPPKPLGKGSGNANGKTAKRHNKVTTKLTFGVAVGNPNAKARIE